MARKEASKDPKKKINAKPPIQWTFLEYRRLFNLSASEFKKERWGDVSSDLEMLSIEAEIENKVTNTPNGNSRQPFTSYNRH